jgi:hypothetical protein
MVVMVVVVVGVVRVVVAVLSVVMDVIVAMDPPPSTFSIVRFSQNHNHNGGLLYFVHFALFVVDSSLIVCDQYNYVCCVVRERQQASFTFGSD